MAKLIFLVLDGCSKCQSLKNKLGYFNNSFKFYSCDGENPLCDDAETLTGVDSYPMTLVLDINNNIEQIVYFTDEYDKVGKKIELTKGVKGYPVYSVDQMVDYVTKL